VKGTTQYLGVKIWFNQLTTAAASDRASLYWCSGLHKS